MALDQERLARKQLLECEQNNKFDEALEGKSKKKQEAARRRLKNRLRKQSDSRPATSVSINAAYDLARIMHGGKSRNGSLDPKAPKSVGVFAMPESYEEAIETLMFKRTWLPAGSAQLEGSQSFHTQTKSDRRDIFIKQAFEQSCLYRLLKESRNGCHSAILSERINVSGNVFADNIRLCGSFRLKYGTIGGRFDLKGARLRSARSVYLSLKYRKVSYDPAFEMQALKVDGEPPVLDLEESTIGGALNLGKQHKSRGATIKSPVIFDLDEGGKNQIDFENEAWVPPTKKGSGALKPILWGKAFHESKVTKTVYHFGDESLLRAVAQKLIESRDDPMKYRWIFNPDRNESSLNTGRLKHSEDQITSETSLNQRAVLHLKYALLHQAKKYNPKYNDHYWTARKRYEASLRDQYASQGKRPRIWDYLTDAASFGRFVGIRRDSFLSRKHEYDHEDDQALEEILVRFGELRSTLVIGSICINNSNIGGDVNLAGLIANVFDVVVGENRGPKVFLHARHAKIDGDLNFTGSVGVGSIRAQQAKIEGSLRFYHRSEYRADLDVYDPIQGRALLLAADTKVTRRTPNPKLAGELTVQHFERAKVNGNANFVFDPRYGPSLSLFNMTVDGNLTIAPAYGSFEPTIDEYKARIKQNHSERHVLSMILPTRYWVPNVLLVVFASVVLNLWFTGNISNNLLVYALSILLIPIAAQAIRWIGSSIVWMWQLSDPLYRGRRLKLWSYTIGKWTWQGGTEWLLNRFRQFGRRLLISLLYIGGVIRNRWHYAKQREHIRRNYPKVNLRNACATVYGHPSGAWPKQDALLIEGFNYERTMVVGPLGPIRRSWRAILQSFGVNFVGGGLVSIFAIFGLYIWFGSYDAFENQYEFLGPVSLGLLLLLSHLAICYSLLAKTTSPNFYDNHPQAIEWLKLQRRQFSEGKIAAAVLPVDPFMRAIAALRASGRNRSAELVELERLRMRRRSLSWRTAGPLRVFLLLTDFVIRYGYQPFRAVMFILIAMLLGSMGMSAVEHNNQIEAADMDRLELTLYETNEPLQIALEKYESCKDGDVILVTPKCLESEALKVKNYPKFNAILYTVDVMIPFLDVGQERYWSVIDPRTMGCKFDEILKTPIACAAQSMEKESLIPYKEQSVLSNLAAFYAMFVTMFAGYLVLIGKVFGLLLTSTIIVSLVSRMEAALARHA